MKKGFTLIEMIGVMVILSLLLAFVMPNVINYVKKGGDIKDKATKEILYTAAKKYMKDNKGDFKEDIHNTYCINIKDLSEQGYVESPIILSSSNKDITKDTSTSVKVTYDKKYKYDLEENCEEKIHPTPVLSKGLTPIKYDEENSKWVVADKTKNDWYDYDKQEWANAVTLLPGVTKKVGDEVKVDGTEASMMLVWIPKYEYKIEGDYGKGGTSADLPGEIEVNFVLRTKKGYNETTGYRVHPAFTFGDQDVSGFWIGKFELSHETLSSNVNVNNLNCSTENCENASGFRILPNVASLRSNNVANLWYGIKSIENTDLFGLSNIDSHMIKNAEWGAVAYLSQSKYGKYGNKKYTGANKEIYQNKSSNYITGSSNGTPTQSDSRSGDQCVYNDMQDLGEDTNGYKKGQCGPGASTTGNIYGVYDMNGGTWEYMMSARKSDNKIYIGRNSEKNSGFKGLYSEGGEKIDGVNLPDLRYYDLYTADDTYIACDNDECYGHALSETNSWYNNNAINPTNGNYEYVAGYFDLLRGGYESFGVHGGIFTYGNYDYEGFFLVTSRVVILKK